MTTTNPSFRRVRTPVRTHIAEAHASVRHRLGLGQPKRQRVAGCRAFRCMKDRRHGECHECGELSCEWRIRVDPDTLRRRKVHECHSCSVSLGRRIDEPERRSRVEADWDLGLDDQFPGISRQILREFILGPDATMLVGDSDPATLNASIAVMGFSSDVYAELRSGRTVLRRVTSLNHAAG